MRKEMLFFVGVVVAGALLFGCATMKGIEEPATKGDLNRQAAAWGKQLQESDARMEAKIDSFAAKVEKLTGKPPEAIPLAPKKEEVAAVLSVKPEAAAPAQNEAVADLQKRVGMLEIKTSNMGNAVADVSRDVGLLKKKVANIEIRVAKVSRNAGISLGLLLKPGERAFLIHFKKGSSEIKGRTAQEIKALKTLMKAGSYLAARFVAFADEEGFKGLKRDSPENETRNAELAKRRGNAVKDNLEEDPDDEIVVDSAAEVESYGATDQFGPDHESNRVVVVVLKKNE